MKEFLAKTDSFTENFKVICQISAVKKFGNNSSEITSSPTKSYT